MFVKFIITVASCIIYFQIRLLAVLSIILIFMTLFPLKSISSSLVPLPQFPVTGGEVKSVHESNGILYLGGSFSGIGKPTSYLASINTTTGSSSYNFPSTDDSVSSIISDGSGGWYIGGSFYYIGDIYCPFLAHVLSDGSVDPNFYVEPDDVVHTLTLLNNTLFAGGDFFTIGGKNRNYLAAIDLISNTVNEWNPNPNDRVRTLVAGQNTLYVGGDFTTINGQTRNHIAAIEPNSNQPSTWNPNAGDVVTTLGLSGTTLYAGGEFGTIGGQTRSGIAALDISTGNATSWNPNADNTVIALTISGDTVYVGGGFTSIGGQARIALAALDISTGNATAWNPNPNNYVSSIAVHNNTVYAGGAFSTIGGESRSYIAALDANTGNAKNWTPYLDNEVGVLALSQDGQKLYTGGNFKIVGTSRNNLAAVNLTTNEVTSWNPNANGTVNTISTSGNSIYIGGDFTSVNGQTRNRIAELDITTGNVTSWDPNADNSVLSLFISGNSIYAGGSFSTIGGQSRNRIAALDNTNGAATAWNPNANNTVRTILVYNNTIFTGGDFTTIGGQSRNRIAALDTTNGAATTWNPDANNTVNTITISNNDVYLGGSFTTISGQIRNRIAAIDSSSGVVHAWNPNANNTVLSLVSDSNYIYAGGDFTAIGGKSREYLSVLNKSDGNAESFSLEFDAKINSISLNERYVYVGGLYNTIEDIPFLNLSALAFNNFPNTINDSVTTNEDTPVQISASSILANDSDADNDPLQIACICSANQGTVSFSNSILTFSPNENFAGTARVDLLISDGISLSSSRVNITVHPVNDAPIAHSIMININEDSKTPVYLSGSDVDNSSLKYELFSYPQYGMIENFEESNGKFIYTGNPNFVGTDIVKFRITDGIEYSNIGQVTINVMNTNDAPIAQQVDVTVYKNQPTRIQLQGVDLDHDYLLYTIASQPHNGSLSYFSFGFGNLTYTPNLNYVGNDSFTYTVFDDELTSSPGIVYIQIEDEPTATPTPTSTLPPTASPTPTLSPTPTPTPTVTSTPSNTFTPSPTSTNTPRLNNHPPQFLSMTTIPENIVQNSEQILSVFLQDDDGDLFDISIVENGAVKDKKSASNWGKAVITLTLDTAKLGMKHIELIAYDGSDTSYFEVQFNVVESIPLTDTPTPSETSSPIPSPTPIVIVSTPTPTHTETMLPPTPLMTSTPVSTPTSTSASFLHIYDSVNMTQNIAGGIDVDEIDERELIIHWQFDIQEDDISEYHLYVCINDSDYFEFLGQTRSSSTTHLRWIPNSSFITPKFRNGPQSGNSYSFIVYAITKSGEPNDYGPLTTFGMIEQRPEQPLQQEYLELDFGDVFYSAPNRNDHISNSSLVVYDSEVESSNIINTVDYDLSTNKSITIKWDIPEIEKTNIVDYHVYIRVNKDKHFHYLGKSNSNISTYLNWKQGNQNVSMDYRSGPQFGKSYEFIVYGITENGYPDVYGPITTQGPINFVVGNDLNEELQYFDFGSVTYKPSIIITDHSYTFDDLSGLEDQDENGNEALTIRWTIDEIDFNGIPFDTDSIVDTHIYAAVGEKTLSYLGRTGNGSTNFYEWCAGNGNIVSRTFVKGPKTGSTYQFAVFYILNQRDENNHFIKIGPCFTSDSVSFTSYNVNSVSNSIY